MKRLLAALLVSWVGACALPLLAAPEEYEMTTYYVGFLYRGPHWSPEDTPERAKIQEGHMAHIRKMAETGKLVLAGPFLDDGELRGMFVFRVASLEEAKALAEQDPAVQSGRLRLEWRPWLGAKNILVTPRAPAAGSR